MLNETAKCHIFILTFVFPQEVCVIWYLRNVIESNWANQFTILITKFTIYIGLKIELQLPVQSLENL